MKRALVLATILLAPSAARADVEKTACAEAANRGQVLRDQGRLKDARTLFNRCAQTSCPAVVRSSCTEWLADVDVRTPTVIFKATLDGKPVTDVRVTSGDEVIATSLTDKAIPLDPGSHALRYTLDDQQVSDSVTIREREKNRVVEIRLTSPTRPAPPAMTHADEPPAPAPPQPDVESRPVPAGVWLLAGVGVVGMVGFTAFGLSAKNKLDTLRSTCAPNCSTSDKDSAHQRAVFADVSLGVGVAAFVAAGVWFLARPTVRTTGLVVVPTLSPTSASLDLAARF